MMRRSAGFDANEARRQLLKEWQNVSALELTTNDYITCRVNSVDLKKRLSNIETDGRDRLHVWLLRIVGPQQHPRPWHFRAGAGAVHSINSGHNAVSKLAPVSAAFLQFLVGPHDGGGRDRRNDLAGSYDRTRVVRNIDVKGSVHHLV